MDNNDNQSGGGAMPGGINNIDGINRTNYGESQPSVSPENQFVSESNQVPISDVPREDFVSTPSSSYGSSIEGSKKSHKGLIIFLIILVVLIGLGFLFYYLLATQTIKNDWFPGNEPEQPVQPVTPEVKPTKKYNNYSGPLDFSFLKMEDKEENLIYSPLSVKYALSLLNDGAAGKTKEQIEAVLNGIELTKYENVKNKLSLANAVFIKNDFQDSVKEEYVSGVTEKYNADVLYDEFTDVRAIDSWIDNKTFGLIKDSGVNIDPNMEMVLTNALAIQLDWKRQFEAEYTRGMDFEYTDGKDEATMMSNSFSGTSARLYDDGAVSAVAMDLKAVGDTELEFVAILPEGELSDFVENADEKVGAVLDGLVDVADFENEDAKKLDHLKVYIPKFKFDYELENFGAELSALGVEDAFNKEKADFSEMAEKPLYVSQAIHKANIDFSEDGIKAAAITVFVMDSKAALDEPARLPVIKTITFDKPFMFVIRDKNTGEKWFVGTVYEPNKWADDEAEYERQYE